MSEKKGIIGALGDWMSTSKANKLPLAQKFDFYLNSDLPAPGENKKFSKKNVLLEWYFSGGGTSEEKASMETSIANFAVKNFHSRGAPFYDEIVNAPRSERYQSLLAHKALEALDDRNLRKFVDSVQGKGEHFSQVLIEGAAQQYRENPLGFDFDQTVEIMALTIERQAVPERSNKPEKSTYMQALGFVDTCFEQSAISATECLEAHKTLLVAHLRSEASVLPRAYEHVLSFGDSLQNFDKEASSSMGAAMHTTTIPSVYMEMVNATVRDMQRWLPSDGFDVIKEGREDLISTLNGLGQRNTFDHVIKKEHEILSSDENRTKFIAALSRAFGFKANDAAYKGDNQEVLHEEGRNYKALYIQRDHVCAVRFHEAAFLTDHVVVWGNSNGTKLGEDFNVSTYDDALSSPYRFKRFFPTDHDFDQFKNFLEDANRDAETNELPDFS